MEFQEILIDSAHIFILIAVVVSMIGAALVICSVAAFMGSKAEQIEKDKKAGAWFLVIGAILLAVGYFTMSHSSSVRAGNDEALISNIEKKYEVDEVVLSDVGISVVAEWEKDQNVNVVVDDKTYTFYVSQDKNTWEPTLTNPAIPGGSSDVVNLSAEDLLK